MSCARCHVLVGITDPSRRNHRAVPGYDELHNDNFRIKDAKNNVILCFACGKSALEHREIISCDYCNLKWHLDCLSPPLANRPFRDLQHRQKHSWMCPAHVEQEMRTIGYGGRMHKVRRPKNAKVVDTALRRGLRNNGIIEIENDPSDAEDFVGMEDSVIYRLSEQGIKLDFLDRIKRQVFLLNDTRSWVDKKQGQCRGRRAPQERRARSQMPRRRRGFTCAPAAGGFQQQVHYRQTGGSQPCRFCRQERRPGDRR